MPEPKKGEHREAFVKRCIPVLIGEGKEAKQAVAICNSMFDNRKKDYEDVIAEFEDSLKCKNKGV